MRVLIACEYSGIVREAFAKRGHDAWSCDILPTEIEGQHFQCDIFKVIDMGWDLMIAHPPCTHLAVSGAAWFKEKIADGRQQAGLDFVKKLMDAPINKICIENPVSVISSKIRKPDQIIQPYYFGNTDVKKTCLWLKNLPLLKHTNVVEPEYYYCKSKKSKSGFSRSGKVYKMGSGYGKQRSKFFPEIAEAMASQWG